MVNLFDCADVAIIFLDPQQRIKRLTPLATRLFNLIATDLGRPIGDIKPKFADPGPARRPRPRLQTLAPAGGRGSSPRMAAPGCAG